MPSAERLSDGRDALHCAILEHLKSKSTLPSIIAFRHDVFNFYSETGAPKAMKGDIFFLEK